MVAYIYITVVTIMPCGVNAIVAIVCPNVCPAYTADIILRFDFAQILPLNHCHSPFRFYFTPVEIHISTTANHKPFFVKLLTSLVSN